MSKVTAAHLGPLATAIDMALRDGSITVEQIYDFHDRVYHSYLEQRQRNGDARAKHILEYHADQVKKGSGGNR